MPRLCRVAIVITSSPLAVPIIHHRGTGFHHVGQKVKPSGLYPLSWWELASLRGKPYTEVSRSSLQCTA